MEKFLFFSHNELPVKYHLSYFLQTFKHIISSFILFAIGSLITFAVMGVGWMAVFGALFLGPFGIMLSIMAFITLFIPALTLFLSVFSIFLYHLLSLISAIIHIPEGLFKLIWHNVFKLINKIANSPIVEKIDIILTTDIYQTTGAFEIV
jgi:hypothetical protein